MSNRKSVLCVFLVLIIVILGCNGSHHSASRASGSGSLSMSEKAIDEFGKNYVERFEQMFKTGNISFCIKNKKDSNVLHYAAFTGDLNRVKKLVEMGGNVNQFDSAGKSDAQKGIEFLSNSNNCSGKTSLYYAAQSGNLEVVKYLVEKGAIVNVKDKRGLTPMHYAVQSGNLDVVKFLVEKGANVNAERVYHISFNVLYGFKFTETPLYCAARSGNLELVKYLMEEGSLGNNDIMNSAAESGKMEMVKWFVENGVDVNAVVKLKRNNLMEIDTILHYAVRSGNLEMVKYFVELGTDVNAKGDSDQTVFYTAARSGNLEIVKYLIEKDADFDTNWALCYAAESGNLDMVKFFVDKGADVKGKSVLSDAVTSGNLELVKWLVSKGADINAKNINGKTPLGIVSEIGNQDVVDYLKDHGAKK